ncbi:MAG: AbgT family transporter [Bacilli bacterium]
MKSKRLIIRIESLLNKTPNIGLLIIGGIVLVMIASAIVSSFTGQLTYVSIDPDTLEKQQNIFEVKNYLIPENFMNFISKGLYNYSSLGSAVTILVIVIAFGIAEKSGFIYTILKKLLFNVPKNIVTIILVFVGILSNVSSIVELNAGYLFLLPLSAFIYMGNGRNPLAGIATMFAAIFAGYNINILLTNHALFLNDITTAVVNTTLPNYVIQGSDNRFIMGALIILSTFLITVITEKYIVNILPVYDLEVYTYHRITDYEKRGLFVAIIYSIVSIIAYIYFLVPKNVIDLPGSGLLLGNYNPVTTSYLTQLIRSPLFVNFAIHISYYFIIAGTLYGIFSKKFSSLNEVMKSAVVSIADNAEYFVLAFLLSQFIFIMYDSNLSLYILLKLVAIIPTSGSLLGMAVALFIVTAIINLIIPTSVTKWAIIAPIVLPAFVGSLVNPLFAQTIFQLGDSATNTISILMPYTIFAYVLFNIYAKKTKQHCGNGTYFKLTFPYSMALTGLYFIVIVIWVVLNIGLGPNVPLFI